MQNKKKTGKHKHQQAVCPSPCWDDNLQPNLSSAHCFGPGVSNPAFHCGACTISQLGCAWVLQVNNKPLYVAIAQKKSDRQRRLKTYFQQPPGANFQNPQGMGMGMPYYPGACLHHTFSLTVNTLINNKLRYNTFWWLSLCMSSHAEIPTIPLRL